MESFSDDEDCEAIDMKNNSKTENLTNSKNTLISNESIDIDSNFNKNDSAAEIRKLLRRKDELERKQKMQDKFDERLKVSRLFLYFFNQSNKKNLWIIKWSLKEQIELLSALLLIFAKSIFFFIFYFY